VKGVEKWWQSVKDCEYWSGSIVGLLWDELWPEAQKELTKIYEKTIEPN
jgi:hypothetical protein